MAQTRTAIIAALETQLVAINGTGSYGTAVVLVDRFRTKAIEAAHMPAIVIRDMTARTLAPEGSASPYNKKDWNMPVQLELVMDGATDVQIRTFIKDVYLAVGSDPTFGGNAIDADQVSDQILIDQEDKRITGAIVMIDVLYRTRKWQES